MFCRGREKGEVTINPSNNNQLILIWTFDAGSSEVQRGGTFLLLLKLVVVQNVGRRKRRQESDAQLSQFEKTESSTGGGSLGFKTPSFNPRPPRHAPRISPRPPRPRLNLNPHLWIFTLSKSRQDGSVNGSLAPLRPPSRDRFLPFSSQPPSNKRI